MSMLRGLVENYQKYKINAGGNWEPLIRRKDIQQHMKELIAAV